MRSKAEQGRGRHTEAYRGLLEKLPWSLISQILLDTKKGFGGVVKFLNLLPQLLC